MRSANVQNEGAGTGVDAARGPFDLLLVIVVAVVVRKLRCELTFPSRRLRSMDSSPSPIVTTMEYQCLPIIALGMEANTSVFERSSSPPDAVTNAISPNDQTA